jgi:plasmid stability protein
VPDILVHDVDNQTVEVLKASAATNSRSLESEARNVLAEWAARTDRRRQFRETIERWQAHWRAEGKTFSDSAEIIRELREERENRY